MSRLHPPKTVSADEADSLQLTIRELRAENNQLFIENEQLRAKLAKVKAALTWALDAENG